jgi:hypothetical protein
VAASAADVAAAAVDAAASAAVDAAVAAAVVTSIQDKYLDLKIYIKKGLNKISPFFILNSQKMGFQRA